MAQANTQAIEGGNIMWPFELAHNQDRSYECKQPSWFVAMDAPQGDDDLLGRANILALAAEVGMPELTIASLHSQTCVYNDAHTAVLYHTGHRWYGTFYLLVKPSSKACQVAAEVVAGLDQYPVVNDDLLTEVEDTIALESIRDSIQDYIRDFEFYDGLDVGAVAQWFLAHCDDPSAYAYRWPSLRKRYRDSADASYFAQALRSWRNISHVA